jgi:hypothetical protein
VLFDPATHSSALDVRSTNTGSPQAVNGACGRTSIHSGSPDQKTQTTQRLRMCCSHYLFKPNSQLMNDDRLFSFVECTTASKKLAGEARGRA